MLIYKARIKLNIVELTIVDTGVVEIGGFIFARVILLTLILVEAKNHNVASQQSRQFNRNNTYEKTLYDIIIEIRFINSFLSGC